MLLSMGQWTRAHHTVPLLAAILTGAWASAPIANAEPVPEPGDDSGYETVVTPSRGQEPAFESPRAIETLSASELEDKPPATTPEALENEPGIVMQRTNTGGGAPIIRGLMGQHVLLLVDGIRLNNSITRFGPNQLLNTVDPYQIERVEVMRGPGSVLYGSDAMGGVVNLITRRAAFDPRRAWDASAELKARFDSADSGLVGHLAASGHLRSFGLRIGGSLKDFGELAGGRDTGAQRFTAYQEGDADLSLTWALGAKSLLRLFYGGVRQEDAPRTDRSTPSDFLRFTDQFRDMATLSYSGQFDDSFLKQVDATLSFHHQRELRERFRIALDRIDRQEDTVTTLGTVLTLRTDLPYTQLTYGVDFYNDWVGSSEELETISRPERTPQDRGRYVDGSGYSQLGVYLLDRIALGRKLAFDLGARVNSWWIDVPRDLKAGLDAVQSTRTGVVGSLHARYLVGDGLNLVAGVSQGYRAPNIDDLSAMGCSGQGYDVPNDELDSEKSVTAEAGVKFDLHGIFSGSLFYYYTYLHDQIVRMSSKLDENGTVVTQKQCGTSSTGAPVMVGVFARDNAKSGQIHGVELSLRLALGRHWSLFSWATWTRGEVTLDLDVPVDFSEPTSRIPPLNGMAGVRYSVGQGMGFAELGVRWAGRQDRLSTSDRGDRRICPDGPIGCDGTPPFAVVTLRGAARLSKCLRLTMAVENLTNETYRVHGSGVDGAGLSAILGMELVVQ
jgi:outer membrane receptor protein involved in Fe transport